MACNWELFVDGELLQLQVHHSDVYMILLVVIGWEKQLALEKGQQTYGFFSTERIDESTCQ